MLMSMPPRLAPRLVPWHMPGSDKMSDNKGFGETTGWDKNCPPPALPDEVVRRTREKYLEAFTRLVGKTI